MAVLNRRCKRKREERGNIIKGIGIRKKILMLLLIADNRYEIHTTKIPRFLFLISLDGN